MIQLRTIYCLFGATWQPAGSAPRYLLTGPSRRAPCAPDWNVTLARRAAFLSSSCTASSRDCVKPGRCGSAGGQNNAAETADRLIHWGEGGLSVFTTSAPYLSICNSALFYRESLFVFVVRHSHAFVTKH